MSIESTPREAFDKVTGLSGEEFLVANAIGLFIAAHDTTSVFLSFLFYELALNADVQQKLQVNHCLLQLLHSGMVCFELIMCSSLEIGRN